MNCYRKTINPHSLDQVVRRIRRDRRAEYAVVGILGVG